MDPLDAAAVIRHEIKAGGGLQDLSISDPLVGSPMPGADSSSQLTQLVRFFGTGMGPHFSADLFSVEDLQDLPTP